jgi:predicted nucleic acid-binding protein
VIIADTSGLLAFFNSSEPAHGAVVATIAERAGPLMVSPFVIAELDYLVATRVGTHAELTMLSELSSGAYELPGFDARSLSMAREVVAQYVDQNIGIADASLVVLAARYSTRTLLTLDHRHFDVIRSLHGEHFVLLP